MSRKLIYFCIGCKEVHYDRDCSLKNGDLIIEDLDRFFKSVNIIKKLKAEEKKDE